MKEFEDVRAGAESRCSHRIVGLPTLETDELIRVRLRVVLTCTWYGIERLEVTFTCPSIGSFFAVAPLDTERTGCIGVRRACDVLRVALDWAIQQSILRYLHRKVPCGTNL